MRNETYLEHRPDIHDNYYELMVVIDQRLTELNAPLYMRPVHRRWFQIRRWFLRRIGRWDDEKVKIVERVERDVYRRKIRNRNR